MKTVLILFLVFIIWSCGNHERATGGKKDVTKPEIIAVSPPEFSNISELEYWEIVFSKPMDKSSIFTGIYIYPPLPGRTYRWDKNTLQIHTNGELIKDKNYYLSFSTAIRCERRNPLDKNYLLVYATGILQKASISGAIEYELSEDKQEEITINVAAADTTFMFRQKIVGNHYQIEHLHPQKHVITAFIDKNNNNRYDFGREPYFRFTSPEQNMFVQDIYLAYADTTKPRVQRINVQSQKQFTAFFNKDISMIENVEILSDSSKVNILTTVIEGNSSLIVTSALDTLEYTVIFHGVKDFKENISDSLSITFDGIAKPDSLPPVLLYSKPGDGDSVYELIPEIVLEFTDLVPSDGVEAYLYANERQVKVDLILKETNHKKFVYKPKKPLSNYSTYKLFFKVENWFGIPYQNDGDINFIIVVHDE